MIKELKTNVDEIEPSGNDLINKTIEHRQVYDDYNFQSIKRNVACENCQYYENEECNNRIPCFWLDLEKKLTVLMAIKKISKSTNHFRLIQRHNFGEDEITYYFVIDNCEYRLRNKEEFESFKEVIGCKN